MLRVLRAHEVNFIVVGGVCAALHGSPALTGDLDIVHARTAINLDRLESALRELGAVYRMRPEQRLAPSRSALAGPGHQLLISRYGSLDVLGSISGLLEYESLLAHSQKVDLGEGLEVLMLDLPTLISTKEALGRPKDLASVAELKQVLAEQSGKPPE